MIEELNLQCPYKVTFNLETSTYSFTTKNDIEYSLAFVDSVCYFSGVSESNSIKKVYSLNIDKISAGKAVLDLNVQATVNCIVTHFFKDLENSLVYVCDHSDSKHEARRRKFNRWCEQSDSNSKYIKLDEILITDDGVHNVSLIYHFENPFSESLEAVYYEVIEELRK